MRLNFCATLICTIDDRRWRKTLKLRQAWASEQCWGGNTLLRVPPRELAGVPCILSPRILNAWQKYVDNIASRGNKSRQDSLPCSSWCLGFLDQAFKEPQTTPVNVELEAARTGTPMPSFSFVLYALFHAFVVKPLKCRACSSDIAKKR